jgi:hypothetical protein
VHSLSRLLRDAFGAAVMADKNQILAQNAQLLMTAQDH